MFPVVIHHNPACGTSRNVLAIIKAAGYEPDVVEYLKTGWTRPQLLALFAAANLTPRNALRNHRPKSLACLSRESAMKPFLPRCWSTRFSLTAQSSAPPRASSSAAPVKSSLICWTAYLADLSPRRMVNS